MKITYIFFAVSLAVIAILSAMDEPLACDVALEKKLKIQKYLYDMTPQVWPTKRCANLLRIPLRDAGLLIKNLSEQEQDVFRKQLESSFIFNLIALPKELCLDILHKAYDDGDNQDNSNSFFCSPLMKAITIYKESENNPITIGGRALPLSVLLAYSEETIQEISSIAHPSALRKFFEGINESVLSPDDYERIIEVFPDDVQLEVTVLPSYGQRAKVGLCGHRKVCNSGLLLCWGGVLVTLNIPFVFGAKMLDGTDQLVMYSVAGIVDSCIILGAILHTISSCRDYVVEQAQNNRVV